MPLPPLLPRGVGYTGITHGPDVGPDICCCCWASL
jgi:hypothetical protein